MQKPVTEKKKYFVVRERAVPEVLLKVVEAKKLLDSGKVDTVQDAAERTGISRSSFYKYKDDIFPFHEETRGKTITFIIQMDDEPGLLSVVLQTIARFHGNILTIHQNIPVDSVAPVSISLRTNQMNCSEEELLEKAKKLPGVLDIKFISGH